MSSEYRYSTGGHTNPSSQPGLERIFQQLISREGPSRAVCDLGCGNGWLAGTLAKRGFDVVGVDSSASGIEMARQHNGEKNASFVLTEIDEHLPAKLVSGRRLFDVVISSDVIEHLYSPSVLVKVAHRILRPGGLLLVGTPYHGYWKNLAISLLDRWDSHHGVHWDGGHIKFFSVRTLGAMVREQGFETPEFHFFGRCPLLWKNMICATRKPWTGQ